jgi:GntR family transcriptional repressor for pyruvate dehydrogenase complex
MMMKEGPIMTFKKIKRKKIYEEVADALIQMIRDGQFVQGDKLDSVEQLAENFQVGRSAIREALTALRAMGIVDMRQGEGTFIRSFDPNLISTSITSAVLMSKSDLQHLLEVRKVLESGTAEAAAIRRSQEELDKMKASLTQMADAIGNDSLGEQADWSFHLAIAQASHNPLLINLMNNVGDMMIEAMKETRRIWIFSKEHTIERLLVEHSHIYDAIEKGDPELARQFMLTHLESVEKVLTSYFDKTE